MRHEMITARCRDALDEASGVRVLRSYIVNDPG